MGNATVYKHDDEIFDLISPASAGGYYHVFALKNADDVRHVAVEELRVGDMLFRPGQVYSRFGSTKHTSAGFISYDGEPLTFVGTYKEHALFVDKNGPFDWAEYPVCYWSWKYSVGAKMFIGITNASAARRMDL